MAVTDTHSTEQSDGERLAHNIVAIDMDDKNICSLTRTEQRQQPVSKPLACIHSVKHMTAAVRQCFLPRCYDTTD